MNEYFSLSNPPACGRWRGHHGVEHSPQLKLQQAVKFVHLHWKRIPQVKYSGPSDPVAAGGTGRLPGCGPGPASWHLAAIARFVPPLIAGGASP